jgi:Spy/CpxP family protein refolding chaperone
MKFPTIVLGLSTFIFSGMTLAAEPVSPRPETISNVLQLDKTQKGKLIKLHATAQECMNNIDASQFDPRAFLSMVKTGKFDEALLKQQMAIQNELHTQAARCRITYYTEVSQTLTQEQKQKLVDMYQQQMDK